MTLHPAHQPPQAFPSGGYPASPEDVGAPDASPDAYVSAARATSKVLSDCMALPFDMARERYAGAVRAGLIERSLLASSQFGLTLTALEHLALGPWARRP